MTDALPEPENERPAYAVLIVDSESHTASLLAERAIERGHHPTVCTAEGAQVRALIGSTNFDAFLLDYHQDRHGELEMCALSKSLNRELPVMAIAAPGLAQQTLEAWNATRRCVDHVFRKPIAGDALFRSLEGLVGQRRAHERAGRYARLIAEDGRQWADSAGKGSVLVEQAILFTDIRRSTQIISTLPLPEWFEAINRALSEQGRAVRECGGSVVKYTGDGLMASFGGRGRSYRTMRCAMALQELDRTARYRDSLRVGVGLAEGLVMTGLIGEPGRQQYDVIGATVHLAARLCSIAKEGEIVATPRLVRSAGMAGSMPAATRSVQLRGFAAPVECVSFPAFKRSAAADRRVE